MHGYFHFFFIIASYHYAVGVSSVGKSTLIFMLSFISQGAPLGLSS